MTEPIDVVVVGAGPAGLSGALILGRCQRRVVVLDSGEYRNARSATMHGFLSRDGMNPAEFRAVARADLSRYPTVELRAGEAVAAAALDGGFTVQLAEGTQLRCRRLLLATGMVDGLPPIPGCEEFFGTSLFHCPYCDGWEVSDQPLAAYGAGGRGMGLALELTGWSRDLVLCTDGPSQLRPDELDRLARNGIGLREERISRLEGSGGILERVVFDDGDPLARRALFFVSNERQRSPLADSFGCSLTRGGAVRTGPYETTEVPGLYVAGDASRSVQMVLVAAAEGAEAAFAINTSLLREDLV